MGRGRIISGNNPYQVEILENTGRVQARIDALQKNLTRLQGDITAVSVRNDQLLAEVNIADDIFSSALESLVAAINSGNEANIKLYSDAVDRALNYRQEKVGELRLNSQRLSNLNLQKDSLQTSLESAQSLVQQTTGEVMELWCADYATSLNTLPVPDRLVGLIELPSSDVTPIAIYPNHQQSIQGSAAWDDARDGQAQPNGNMTAAGWFINTALNACMAKWRPRYRVGTVTEVFSKQWGVLPRARVTLDQVTVDGIEVNQYAEVIADVDYMRTYKVGMVAYYVYDISLQYYRRQYKDDRRALLNVVESGDRVIIDFNGDQQTPVIIGFNDENSVSRLKRYPAYDVYLDDIYNEQFYVKPFCFGYFPQVIVRFDKQNEPFTEVGRFNIRHTNSPVSDNMDNLLVESVGYTFGWIDNNPEGTPQLVSYSVNNYTMAQFYFNIRTYKSVCEPPSGGINKRFHLIAGGCVSSGVPGIEMTNVDPEVMLERIRPVTREGDLVLCDFDVQYVGDTGATAPNGLYSLPKIYNEFFSDDVLINQAVDSYYNTGQLHFECIATDDPDWTKKQPGPLPRVSSEMGPLTLTVTGASIAVQPRTEPLLSYSIANNPHGGSDRPAPLHSLCIGENPSALPGLDAFGGGYSTPEEPAIALTGNGLAAVFPQPGLAAVGVATTPAAQTLFSAGVAATEPDTAPLRSVSAALAQVDVCLDAVGFSAEIGTATIIWGSAAAIQLNTRATAAVGMALMGGDIALAAAGITQQQQPELLFSIGGGVLLTERHPAGDGQVVMFGAVAVAAMLKPVPLGAQCLGMKETDIPQALTPLAVLSTSMTQAAIAIAALAVDGDVQIVGGAGINIPPMLNRCSRAVAAMSAATPAVIDLAGVAVTQQATAINSVAAGISSSALGITLTGLTVAAHEQAEPVNQYSFQSAVNLAALEPRTRYRLIARTPGLTPPPVQWRLFTKAVNPTAVLHSALAAGTGGDVGIQTIGQAYLQPPTVQQAVAAWNLETTDPPVNDGKFRLAPFIITRIHFHT